MAEPYLLLWLEGPLQAWGHDSRFGRRDSLDFPSKSGVLGLLCCALGAGGEQRELLTEFADLDMQVAAYVPAKGGKALPRQPLRRDFQMVGNGYADGNPWETLLIPKKSDGGRAQNVSGAKLTYRYYLEDMAFAVALQVPAGRAANLASALQNPVWDLYLGRKNCAPTEFIYQGQYDTAMAALNRAGELPEELAKNRNQPNQARILAFRVIQGVGEGEVIALNDVPVQFGERKLYRDRRVTIIPGD
jgi:CRISPR system Cascade subunit CasD